MTDPETLAADILAAMADDRAIRATTGRRFGPNPAMRRCIELQHQAAVEFGEARGWRLVDREFDFVTLARGKMHGGGARLPRPFAGGCLADHPFYYRRDRKAAAIVVHNYDDNERACEAFAARMGLTFEAPADAVSWWFPGFTRLFVYRGPAS